jgi:hypothetical protein
LALGAFTTFTGLLPLNVLRVFITPADSGAFFKTILDFFAGSRFLTIGSKTGFFREREVGRLCFSFALDSAVDDLVKFSSASVATCPTLYADPGLSE